MGNMSVDGYFGELSKQFKEAMKTTNIIVSLDRSRCSRCRRREMYDQCSKCQLALCAMCSWTDGAFVIEGVRVSKELCRPCAGVQW